MHSGRTHIVPNEFQMIPNQFSSIPNQIDWPSSIFTMIGAVVFCLLGAVIPAAKAADTDPVEALRHE